MPMRKLNAKTTKDTKCTRCKAALPKGSPCCMFRERALSMREASYAGTMYPMRLWCAACITPRAEVA